MMFIGNINYKFIMIKVGFIKKQIKLSLNSDEESKDLDLKINEIVEYKKIMIKIN